MLGKDLFRVESNIELSSERFKSLVLFYGPLIGPDALYLYEFLLVKGTSFAFDEVSKLLNSLLISIDHFEELIGKLNEYKLVKTYKAKNEEKYIFILNNPLKVEEFIINDILVRDFILKTSGEYYQSILSNIHAKTSLKDYDDISKKLDPTILNNWNERNESFLKSLDTNIDYDFDTFFDVNEFLKDVSLNLLPMKYRTEDNLKELATLADLYNISYDKMRHFIAKTVKSGSNTFDLNMLRYLCESSMSEYKTLENGDYSVPCELFLMNKQNGKEVTKNDKKIIYNLSHDYHLNPSVINVLLEHGLNNCNNALIEKYLYSIASDLHRNNITKPEDAYNRLNSYEPKSKSAIKPTYSTENNPDFDEETYNEIMRNRGKNV